MINHAWSVLCNKTIIDRDTNNISLDVVEQLSIEGNQQIPQDAQGFVVPLPLVVVSFWYRSNPESPEKGKARIEGLSPSGKKIGNSEFDIDLTQYPRLRTMIKFNGLPIPKDEVGYFFFKLDIDQAGEWKEVARIPLEVGFQSVVSPTA